MDVRCEAGQEVLEFSKKPTSESADNTPLEKMRPGFRGKILSCPHCGETRRLTPIIATDVVKMWWCEECLSGFLCRLAYEDVVDPQERI